MSDKKTFERPFIGTSVFEGITLLFSKDGSYSTILEIRNKALQHAADPSDYEAYHQLLGQCIKLLGPHHILQKTDIIAQKTYAPAQPCEQLDYLQQR